MTATRQSRGRRPRRTVVVTVALAAGLTLGWVPTVSQAQQSPDSWTAEQRAVLRSGLTVDLDFTPVPGVGAQAEAGRLGEAGFADGVRAGAPAETFTVAQDRPQVDGAWRTLGTLQLTFSRPVRNPRLHVSGLAGVATGSSGSTASALRLSVTGGSPAGPALTARSPWKGWTVAGGALGPAGPDGAADGTVEPAGSLELDGTFDTATFRVERRDTAAPGSVTAPPKLRQAFTVTLDEALGSAPSGYGNASHLISDLFLGNDAVSAVPANGLAHRGAGSGPQPAPPEIQPGRTEHTANDPTLSFPRDAAIGRYYDLTVPVSPGQAGATLAGWIDFDRDGHFDATERAQVDITPGAGSATLEWIVPPNVAAGDTWARLRIARDPAQVVAADGFADAGEVEDQSINLAVGAAKPEITSPVAGSAVGDTRPEFHGDSGVAGATVQVQEGTVTLCQARVDGSGNWNCRPATGLSQGEHTVLPSETTSGGVVLRGDPVRITVSTTPPTPPLLTLPEYTNDPGLLLTGTGAEASTVAVTETVAGSVNELCRTAVRADRAWSCLPVEELAEGTHVLTAVAVDPAGNRAAGKPTTLIVDTLPPTKPVLTAPGPGEEVHVVRPRLTGRGEPGAIVTVIAGGDGALCAAVAAVDGSWACNAVRDLGEGEQLLTPTATDRAGNAATGDAVRVRVVLPGAAASPSGSASAVASPSLSPSAGPSASPSPSASASASASSSPSASPSVGASPSALVAPSTSPSAPASPASPAPGSASPLPDSAPASLLPLPGDYPLPVHVPAVRALFMSSVPGHAPQKSIPPTSHTPDTSLTPALAQPLAPPPTEVSLVRHASLGGWRAATCGAFLILTGMTLITRRVLARGSGTRRR
ncbi:Ig-like domain-containing protein [Kitasatospora azatica]|uniref:Ig-like domain-containing protein n=1 Tax=Kitasatospora azatica TaxID=58347 RepID=UPI0012F78D4D|nr:Ig-like domain-containing protein [Kitasatospora azatica]